MPVAAAAREVRARARRLSTCLVYLSPDKGTLDAVSYRPASEFDPITWTRHQPSQPGAESSEKPTG